MTTGNDGTGEFKDCGDDNRLHDGNCARAYRSAHGIGYIVSTDSPRHVQTEEQRQEQKPAPVCLNHFQSCWSLGSQIMYIRT